MNPFEEIKIIDNEFIELTLVSMNEFNTRGTLYLTEKKKADFGDVNYSSRMYIHTHEGGMEEILKGFELAIPREGKL